MPPARVPMLQPSARRHRHGFRKTRVQLIRQRFPQSTVAYKVANLLEFTGDFDLAVEIYTLQAMPLALRPQAIEAAGNLARDLLIICRGRDETDPPGELPWPLTRTDLQPLTDLGLTLETFENFDDPFQPGTRRFRVYWRRLLK